MFKTKALESGGALSSAHTAHHCAVNNSTLTNPAQPLLATLVLCHQTPGITVSFSMTTEAF